MSLSQFFYPKSIAIVGASKKPGKVGHTLVKKLFNFKGKIFYVNAEGYEIFGEKAYKNLKEINEKVDLVIIAVPAIVVKQVLQDCAYKNFKNCIIISSGFSDIGRKDRENEILEIIKKNKIRILGPNNFGVVNTHFNLDCTFARLSPRKGNVAFASQSGALWSFIADYSKKNNLGFSKFISFGDMLDIDFNEALEYLINDKETKVILLYIETLKNGKIFMDLIKKTKKPVIVIKAGKTEEGKKAAHSHTGSLAGSYEIYKAACRQAGAYFIKSLNESLDLAKFLSKNNKNNGKRTLILTNAGGPGVLFADLLPGIDLSCHKNSKLFLSYPDNPNDVLGDADSSRFKEVLSKIKKENFYNNLVIIITPQDMTDDMNIAEEIINFKKESNVNFICCLLGEESFKHSIELLEENNIICFSEIERAAKLINNLHKI